MCRYISRRTKELNELTRQQPNSVRGWLDLAAFQDEIAQLTSKGKRANAQQLKGLVAKQLAILDNGLRHLPNSIPLHLAKLTAAERHLARDEVQAMWHCTLGAIPAEAELWLEFVRFSKGYYSSFTVHGVGVCRDWLRADK